MAKRQEGGQQRVAVRRRFNWPLAVAVLLLVAIGAGSLYGIRTWRHQRRADEGLKTGLAAWQARDWKAAASGLGTYLGLHPRNTDILLKYAEAHLHIQPQTPANVQQAISAYRTVLRADPHHLEAATKVADIYLRQGMPGDADMILERLLANSDDAEARALRAAALEGLGQRREAAETLWALIQEQPDATRAYRQLAGLVMRYPADLPADLPQDVRASPEHLLRMAAEKNPQSADAHIALAEYLAQVGRREEAKVEAARAADGDLAEAGTRTWLAVVLLRLGDLAAAQTHLEAAAAADPYLLTTWQVWADLVRQAGDQQAAGRLATRALEALGSERFAFLPVAAELYILAGNVDAAKACVDEIRTADAANRAVPWLEGLIAGSQGDHRQAIAHLKRAAAARNAPPAMRLALARAYATAGDHAQAARILDALSREQPDLAAVRLELARTLTTLRAWTDAAEHAAAAARLMGHNLEPALLELNARAQLLAAGRPMADNTWPRVEAAIAALRTRHPDDRRTHLLAARIAELRNDTPEAARLARRLQEDETTRLQGDLLDVRLRWRADHRDTDACLARMREVAAAHPGEPEVVDQLAAMLLRAGQRDAAITAFEAGIKDADEAGRRLLTAALARLYAALGDRGQARRVLEGLIQDQPDAINPRVDLLGLIGRDDPEAAQRLVDEIRHLEGDEGFRWRYYQARLWLSAPDWQKRLGPVTDLLQANVTAEPRDAASQLLLAEVYERAGQHALALETCRRAHDANPDSLAIMLHLVQALQRANDLDEAARVLDRAARAGVPLAGLAGLQLEQHLRTGQLDRAVETAQGMHERAPQNVALAVFLASLRMRQNDLDAADTILDTLDQNDPQVMTARVQLLLRQRKTDQALALCDRMVESQKNVPAHLLRARVRQGLGQADLAREDYLTITTLQPDDPQAWVLLADFLAAQNEYQAAVSAILRAVEKGPDHRPAVMRAVRLYWASPDAAVRQEGHDLLKRALDAHPDDASLLALKAQDLLNTNTAQSVEEARKVLDEVTRANPRFVNGWILLAQTHLRLGDRETAQDVVSRGLAADPDAGQRRALLLLRADAQRLRYPTLAAATLRPLWEAQPRDLGLALALADIYRSAGAVKRAIDVLQKAKDAADTAPGMTIVDAALIDSLAADGQTDQALARARAFHAAAPDDPRTFGLLMTHLARAGRLNEVTAGADDWFKRHPDDPATPAALAQSLLAITQAPAGRPHRDPIVKAAAHIAEILVQKHPGDGRHGLLLATAYQTAGDADRAEAEYRRLLARTPDQPIVINNLAWLLCEDEKAPAEALRLADRGRNLFPRLAFLIDTRGVIYHRLGRLEDARREFEECLRLAAPDSPTMDAARFHLARVLVDLGRTREAVARLREVLDRPRVRDGLPEKEKAEARALLARLTANE